ncbi:MAG: archease [Acidobacteria bacterium]|jgi:SHS2 domain-containing protein|nr:MAG: archease [Acidobacteriota bacterium]
MSFYETIDRITADAGIRVWAEDQGELLCRAVLATFSEITNIEEIEPIESRQIEVSSELPFLLADLINRALTVFESEGFVPCRCHVLELRDKYARLEFLGGFYDPSVHESKLLIKAATYHDLKVEKVGDRWVAQVIFDI